MTDSTPTPCTASAVMLPSKLLDEIQTKIDQGDEFLNTDNFTEAGELYRQALSLIPEPKYLHGVALPAFTALGEAYLFSGRYPEALAAFREAFKAPGGVENPLLHLRLGQAYFESGDLKRAADSFIRAYALDGRSIFEGEDERYLSFLASQIEL